VAAEQKTPFSFKNKHGKELAFIIRNNPILKINAIERIIRSISNFSLPIKIIIGSLMKVTFIERKNLFGYYKNAYIYLNSRLIKKSLTPIY
jgi:hypothetical protein